MANYSTNLATLLIGLGLFVALSSSLRPCGRRDACRLVEYSPLIEDTGSGEGAVGGGSGSGQSPIEPSATDAQEQEEEGGDGFIYSEHLYNIADYELCNCTGDGEACPGVNETESDSAPSSGTSVKLDSFHHLKMCSRLSGSEEDDSAAPLQRRQWSLPVCWDFRRATVRLFKELVFEGGKIVNMTFTKAAIGCSCASGRFRKHSVEPWNHGLKLAFPYSCERA